ncbi:hypothetical protein [Streptomyces olivochromogenes]|uniref:Uncharacterized protein n=1 Tax=Streptomyces olivochromogenes TaxID=1963 RepID=A0A250V6P2_STROL|nr:hypothetical protein [Streptomyces olivochromogenes]KUN50191.1 hypothetical protein AQJ27_00095 [Streptomyces olivochromogenes]GAX49706.1 hypothetical protein SO3561_01195 [Streptomyces olivochromogenes]
MQDLLARAIQAHGGVEHWRTLSRFRARSRAQGAIWAIKGKQGAFGELVITGGTRTQRVTIAPYPERGLCITWEPQRQTIQQDNGVLMAEQSHPQARFDFHTRQTPWDDFHAGYFAAEVLWSYLTVPFHLLRDDIHTEEAEPWYEEGATWLALRVTYPKTFATPSKQQTLYFDESGLLRRTEFGFELLGPGPAVHHASLHRRFDGIVIPTRHRVYVRNPDGTRARESTSLAIDIEDAYFT